MWDTNSVMCCWHCRHVFLFWNIYTCSRPRPWPWPRGSGLDLEPQSSEAGVCRGSDIPAIYVGRYWYAYHPQKNLIHANCMQHVLRCWERQSDGSEYKKTLRRPGLCPGPRCGSLQRSHKPPSWWGWADCPSPRTPVYPTPALPSRGVFKGGRAPPPLIAHRPRNFCSVEVA